MIPVVHATPASFDDEVLAPRGELVVVYFWGPDCPNCEFFASRFDALLEALGDVPAKLVKVNAYAHAELGHRYAIFGIPQFHLFRDGAHLGRMSQFEGDAYWLAVVREPLPARG